MVKSSSLKITWAPSARRSLRKAYEYIRQDYPVIAEKVRSDIVEIAESLSVNPTIFPPDRFKKNNPGNYRAFEKHNYRISYKHTDREIRILRIRHTSREPLEY